MTPEENLGDLVRHANEFAARTGFTYTVLAPDSGDRTVVGCVYIYPSEKAGFDARVEVVGPGGRRGSRPAALPCGRRLAR